jgi:hypothetical protein
MRRRVATSRITLRAEALPKSAEFTELNYRTCVTTPEQDRDTTIRLASIVTLLFIVIGFGLRVLASLPYLVSVPLFVLLFVGLLALAYWKFLQERPSAEELLLALVVIGVSVLFGLVNYAPTMRSAYLLVFGPAVLIAAVFSHFVTMQACAFMAVNERIPWRRMRRWQRHSARIGMLATHTDCPELAPYRLGFIFLIAAFAIGFGVLVKTETTEHAGYAAMFGVIGFVVSLLTIKILAGDLGNAPLGAFPETLSATARALRTFVCYNRHQVEAAGLFRFPTKALRPPLVRDIFLGTTLAFLTTALVGVSVSSPSVLIEQYRNAPKNPEVKPEDFKLDPIEEQFAGTLPEAQRAPYFEAKKKQHTAHETESRWATVKRTAVNILIATGAVLALCWLGPTGVLYAVMWFTGGELLNRYYHALEAPDASEVPPEPTKSELATGKRGVTPWDNRIERMRLSRDTLEKEHFYLGSSIEADFPVLLHEDLLYRHAHILGDTGSRKTSIGIAPLVTQIIARENSSVVIIDLKGDRTLFNAVREDAAAVGMPFKWFTNIVGKSSFVFNPLGQSHLHRLTTDQLTQGILQALELEHGEGYGRGHFTALNDCVLSAYFRIHRSHVRSFKQLHRLVSDRDAYRTISKNDEDWRQTRQLVNLVEKIAHLGPMNATAETMKAKPQVIDKQIDMASVLKTPQVVYFYLSSALDPRTVSPIAKLAMFSLLNAAEFRDGVRPRTYVFIDEFQRVISEAMTLFFEQARSKGLHFILANQTIGQLNSKGVDLTNVVESTAGFKQSFKASDAQDIKRIIETSGEAVYHSVSWTRIVTDSFNENSPHLISLDHALRRNRDGVQVSVTEQVGSRMEKNTLIEVSALPLASVVCFTEGSGYTQFSRDWTTVLSEYHISKALYQVYEEQPLPPVDDRTIEVPGDSLDDLPQHQIIEKPIPNPPKVPPGFDDDLERRLNAAAENPPKTPDTEPESLEGA